jgi:hypothetical protein
LGKRVTKTKRGKDRTNLAALVGIGAISVNSREQVYLVAQLVEHLPHGLTALISKPLTEKQINQKPS